MPQSINYKDLITNEACFSKAGRFKLWHQFSPVGLNGTEKICSVYLQLHPKTTALSFLKAKCNLEDKRRHF